jgi:hypothetical protein
MKTNKYLIAVSNAFHTLQCHDFIVSTVALSPDVREHVENEISSGKLFGAVVVGTNGTGHIKVYADRGFMNEFFMSEKLDRRAYHEPSNPKCSVCKVLHRETVGMDKIEARMYPGCSSDEGFLKKGERLQEIIEQDRRTLKKLGITYDQVADRLEYVTKRAKHAVWLWSQDNPTSDYFKYVKKGVVVEGLRISWVSYMGYQDCPYERCEGREALSDTDFTITNVKTGKSIFCSELHPHLIRKHHFFEGHTDYRLDPEIAVEVLGIKPGMEYPIKLGTQYTWNMSSSSRGGCESIEELKKEAMERSFDKEYVEVMTGGTTLDFGKDIEAYLKEDKIVIFASNSVQKIVEKGINGVPFKERITGPSKSMYEKRSFQYVMEC